MKVVLLSLNAKYIHSSLATRSIKAYCEQNYPITLLELTINHEKNQIIKEVYQSQPDVLGISCYIWNINLIKQLVPTLRKILPHMKIVLGGPEVSYDSTSYLEALPVDVVCRGEGEKVWKDYLTALKLGASLETVEGIAYKQGAVIKENKDAMPLPMEDIPFVYPQIEDLTHRILYYEASRGCPFRCQYCLSSIEKGVRFLPLERVKQDLDFFIEKKPPQVKFVDRTFNANPAYAIEIWEYLISHDNGITNFHFEIAAEKINEAMFKTLKKARKGLIQFEIGVQSTNDKVLEAIKRPMSFSKIKTIVRRIKSLGTIHQHLDLIAGLPYEDYTSFKQSFNDIITLRPEQFQLGFLKLLNGSGLKKKALTYGIAYQDEAPYEVLYTSHLSFNELLKLHAIEEMVERFYNSERFQISLAYLYTLYDTPFDFYEALATYWEEQGYDKIHHKKEAYYIYLNAFGQTSKDVNAVLLKECIRFDWLCHEKVKEMPSELISLNQSEYKMLTQAWLHDSEWCKILSRELQQMTPRQRFRKMHIEFFRYDLWTSYQNMQYDNAVPLKITQYKVPQAILFDYSKNPADCMPITQEEDQM